MRRHKQKMPRRFRQLKGDDSHAKAMRAERASHTGLPGGDDTEDAKNWADHNDK